MNYTPEKIHKGTTSSGETFTIREWRFEDIAGIETLRFFALLILACAVFSVAAPILALLAIYYYSGKFHFLQLLAVLAGGFFVFDCHIGWLSLIAVSIFVEEATIEWLLMMNGASVIVCGVLMFFSPMLMNYITKPVHPYSDATYEELPGSAKRNLTQEIEERRGKVRYALLIAFVISMFITDGVIEREKGWSEFGILKKQEATQGVQ